MFPSRYLSELIVAANESKLLKKQQRDASVAEEARQYEMQQLLGQTSQDRLRDLMDKAKAQIVAEVTFAFDDYLAATRCSFSCRSPTTFAQGSRLKAPFSRPPVLLKLRQYWTSPNLRP